MTLRQSNIVIRFFKSLWQIIDGTRRLILNLIFWPIFITVLVILFRNDSLVVTKQTTLLLTPIGNVVEQYSVEPGQRAINTLLDSEVPETQMRDVLAAIRRATSDDRISQMLIRPDYMASIGLSQLQEIEAAISDFKASGKRVYAYAEGMSQHQYYLASMADEIWLHPEGLVILEGYSVFRNFYKQGLDMLGVDVHLFRVGEFKSAAEPFIRNDMSAESAEANLYWLTGLWNDYLRAVSEHRGMTPDALGAVIDEFAMRLQAANGRPSQMALESGLVDQLGTPDQLLKVLSVDGKLDSDDDLESISLNDYVAVTAPNLMSGPSSTVAVIVAQGVITSGSQPPGTIGGESTVRLIRAAREDDRVAAVVLRVDSGGGEVLPSEKIRHELALTREAGKPVVVSMGTVAASGGYWIAMAADEVWANPGTITGSIGIFGLLATIPETLKKIGVFTDGVGTTELAGDLRIDRELSPQLAEIIQAIVDNGYQNFLSTVADARDMSMADVDQVARGRVWSGRQAYERGLIDQLGGLEQAIESAAALARVSDDYQVDYVERPVTTFEQVLLSMTAQIDSWVEISPRSGLMQLLQSELPSDIALLLANREQRLGSYAYCFCTVR